MATNGDQQPQQPVFSNPFLTPASNSTRRKPAASTRVDFSEFDTLTRQLMGTGVDTTSKTSLWSFEEAQGTSLASIKAAMMNTVPEYVLNAVQRLRNYLCGEARSSHITHALSLGVLDRLRDLIQTPQYGSDIKYEVCWILINLSATEATDLQRNTVANAGFIMPLAALLLDQDWRIRLNAAWALGNIAGESEQTRDAVMDCHVLAPLMHIWDGADRSHPEEQRSSIEVAMQALLCLCDWELRKPGHWEQVVAIIPRLSQLLSEYRGLMEPEITALCRAVAQIAYAGYQRSIDVLGDSSVGSLVSIVQSCDVTTLPHALRALVNITARQNSLTQLVVHLGLLQKLKQLLSDSSMMVDVQLSAIMIVHNVAGVPAEGRSIVSSGLLPCILEYLNVERPDLATHRVKAAGVLRNMAVSNDSLQIEEICNQHVASVLLRYLLAQSTRDRTATEVGVATLHGIVHYNPSYNPVRDWLKASPNVFDFIWSLRVQFESSLESGEFVQEADSDSTIGPTPEERRAHEMSARRSMFQLESLMKLLYPNQLLVAQTRQKELNQNLVSLHNDFDSGVGMEG
ncbi:hypothetical protein SmJEL517_g01246 [Synchytrium microbalum]|uniref:Importin subunit alpha n=1 Tax=Synchytrium microbalum TaxID=1806994 RepID=A0A507CEZ6_9FUNG|nr:uncharacterized protein SmJEL517_g01246 [Synchytrium microbalum]TPX36484.1 hypothetical protein SmJEL517_g01246 [Synchytrium microbalum]